MSNKSESTVAIWNNYMDDPKFYVVPGDLQHLNGVYINMGELVEWQPLLTMTYGKNGDEPFKWKHSEIPVTRLKAAIEAADYVIHCGEVP